MTTCLNCSNKFDGNFCNDCGQKAATHKFTMHEWLHEIPHSIFHVDSGFFYTFKNLWLRPGKMINEYLDGKRKNSFSPFLYVLIWCGIFVVISHFFESSAHKEIEITDFKSAAEYLATNYYKAIVVSMILPSALATFLVFFYSDYNFAEHLVLNTFVIAQLIMGDIIIYCVAVSPLADKLKGTVAILNILLKFPYWIWALWQFFRPKNVLLGALQVFFAVILSSIFAQVMISGAAYLLLLTKGSTH